MLKLSRTGALLFVPIAFAFIGVPNFATTFYPDGHILKHTDFGNPPWATWDSPGAVDLHIAGVLRIIAILILPLLLGAALERWSRWRVPGKSLLVFAALPLISVVTGIAFSLLIWGYAWSPPSLDGRVSDVRWAAVGSFYSAEDGTHWNRNPRTELLSHRTELAADLECCADGRILQIIQTQTPLETVPDLSGNDLEELERKALNVVSLEPGTKGYEHQARRLRGVVALGEHASLGPVAFASFTGGQVSNDHYTTYEVFWRRISGEALSSQKYFADVAGIEGTTAFVVVVSMFVLGLPCAAIVVLGITLVQAIGRALLARFE